MAGRYTFGDGDLAAERLRLLAQAFAPSSRAFIQDAVPARPELVIDLGCGPGDTTRLLADVLEPHRTVGVDESASFLALARRRSTPGIRFVHHDVRAMPLPQAPADVIHARFLLTHLDDPQRCVDMWAGQLRSGGRLLLEEIESIETDAPALSRYLDALAAFLGQRGQELYAGMALASLRDERLAMSRPASVLPGAGRAARLFSMNLAAWGSRAVADGSISAADLDALAGDLTAVVADPRRAEIRWQLRQVVVEGPAGASGQPSPHRLRRA